MQSMKMVSACTKMHELSAEGITIVETIEKRREPLPAMEAIYLITPNEKTVKELMSDFQSQHRTQYRAAHVYFTEVCPEERFKYSTTQNWLVKKHMNWKEWRNS